MSLYAESFSFNRNGVARQDVLPSEFVEDYPVLAEVLHGRPSAVEGECPIPPATVNLFVEGSQLKFCLIPKVGNRVAFGCVKDPTKGFVGLELALAAGNFEWKISKRQKGG